MSSTFGPLVGSIDEGTSSARFVLFKAETAEIVCYHQKELKQITPQEGWVEQDPMVLLEVVEECIEHTIEKLIALNGDPRVSLNDPATSFASIRITLNSLCFATQIGHCGRWRNKSA